MRKLSSSTFAVLAASLLALPLSAHAASAPVNRIDFSTAVASPLQGLTYADTSTGVSSSATPDLFADTDAKADERASLSESFDPSQPPPGRRRRVYGRPRYADKMHNSDGSSKLAFEVGAGLTVPSGPTGRYYTPSYKLSVGAGYNWNKAFGVLFQFDYDHFGLTGGNLNTMYSRYTALDPRDDFSGLDGNGHDLSFSVNPTISFQGSGSSGAYIVGGIGYDRKTTNFTLPSQGTYCDYYGFCYAYVSNQTFDQYTSGGVGVNGGFGLTYKMSRFSSQRLFVEARYKYIFTKRDNTLFYTHNAERSGYFPVTAGIRW